MSMEGPQTRAWKHSNNLIGATFGYCPAQNREMSSLAIQQWINVKNSANWLENPSSNPETIFPSTITNYKSILNHLLDLCTPILIRDLWHHMAGAASALFLLDIKGRVLVWRDFRGDVSSFQAERFFSKLLEKEVFSCSFFNSLQILMSKCLQILTVTKDTLQVKADPGCKRLSWFGVLTGFRNKCHCSLEVVSSVLLIYTSSI